VASTSSFLLMAWPPQFPTWLLKQLMAACYGKQAQNPEYICEVGLRS
jgi:hypothetical protein